MIKIFRQVEKLPEVVMCAVKLENGVIIHLRTDGSAFGNDGNTYYVVYQNNKHGDCRVIGYSKDIDKPLELQQDRYPQI